MLANLQLTRGFGSRLPFKGIIQEHKSGKQKKFFRVIALLIFSHFIGFILKVKEFCTAKKGVDINEIDGQPPVRFYFFEHSSDLFCISLESLKIIRDG